MGKIVKLKNKKTGERVYPVTATKAVVDADSGERLNDVLLNKVEEAPMDGNQYARINGAWQQVEAKNKVETVLISLYPNSDAVIGTTVKVVTSDGNEVLNTTWQGSTLICEVNEGLEYTVTCGDVNDYLTPSSVTHTAMAGVSRTITMSYILNVETLNVNVSGLSTGFTITVKDSNGNTLGSQTSMSSTYKITSGITYSVYASAVGGYFAQSPIGSFVAEKGNTRNVTVVYSYDKGTTSPSDGVYIRATTGKYYKAEDWIQDLTPDCVALVINSRKIGIALKDLSGIIPIDKDDYGLYSQYMSKITNETDAKNDFEGVTNTANMLKYNSSMAYAAGKANAYTSPSGKKGHLPALGELNLVNSNIESVRQALILAGGSTFDGLYYSSTLGDGDGGSNSDVEFWAQYFTDNSSNGRCLKYYARLGSSVRAFITL